MKKVFVAMPSGSGFPYPECIFNVLRQEVTDVEIQFDITHILPWQIVHRARNELVRKFLSSDADYLWFVDDDNPPSTDVLQKLIDADKDIISALVPLRWSGDVASIGVTIKGKALLETELSELDDVFEIENCGTGCVLMKRKVLVDMFKETEWLPYMFSTLDFVWNIKKWCLEIYDRNKKYDPSKYICDSTDCIQIRKGEIGEDLYFGNKARGLWYSMYAHKYARCTHYKRKPDFISIKNR